MDGETPVIVQIPPQHAVNVIKSFDKYRAAMTGNTTPPQRTAARNILMIWLNQCSIVVNQPIVPLSEYVDPPIAPRVLTDDGEDYGPASGELAYPDA